MAQMLVDAVTRRVVADTPVNPAYGNRVSLLTLIEKLRALFPQIQPMPLESGLAHTVAWYRDRDRRPVAQVAAVGSR